MGGKGKEGGAKTPPYDTEFKTVVLRADMESAPTVMGKNDCLTVVGADSISARPGRRGRRPLQMREHIG